jgi:hypothetical protein
LLNSYANWVLNAGSQSFGSAFIKPHGPDLHQNPYPGSENAAKTTKITKVCCSEELNALFGKLEASRE